MELSRGKAWKRVVPATLVLLGVAGGPWLWGQFRSLPDGETLAARARQRVVTLEVGGMTCANCAAQVQSQIAAVPGVSAATVRLGQERAHVVCGPEVADSALVEAVRRAGPGFLASVVPK